MTIEDRKMNNFATATDAEYFYAEDANGNQIKIRKNVLYEMFPVLKFLSGGYLGANKDFNEIVESGLYYTGTNINAPVSILKDWFILVITNSIGDILQVTTEYAGELTGLYIRQRRSGLANTWTEWNSLIFTK